MPFESIYLVECEVALAERFDALHDIEQPAARLRRFISEEKRPLPLGEDVFFLADDTVLHDMNFADANWTPKRKPDTRYRKHLVKKALVGSTYNQNANRNLFGAEMGFLWLGTLIVVGASVLMALRPLPVFGRKLSFKATFICA